MAKSCTTAKIRKTTTNQAGISLWWAKGRKPPAPCPDVEDEGTDHGAQCHDQNLGDGRAEEDPADNALLRRVGWAVPRVVVAALGPAQSAQGDSEGECLEEGLPVAAVAHDVGVDVRDGEAQHHREEDDEGDDQGAQGLHDGRIPEERNDPLHEHGDDDEDDLGRVARARSRP